MVHCSEANAEAECFSLLTVKDLSQCADLAVVSPLALSLVCLFHRDALWNRCDENIPLVSLSSLMWSGHPNQIEDLLRKHCVSSLYVVVQAKSQSNKLQYTGYIFFFMLSLVVFLVHIFFLWSEIFYHYNTKTHDGACGMEKIKQKKNTKIQWVAAWNGKNNRVTSSCKPAARNQLVS